MNPVTLEQALHLAQDAAAGGRLAEAESICQHILTVFPGQPMATYLLANVAFQAGRPDVAEELLRRNLAAFPSDPRPHAHLGELLLPLGRREEAAASFERALALRPDDATTHNNLGAALFGLGRLAEARARFEQALALQPEDAHAYNNLGNVLCQEGRIAEAQACFERAIALQPGLAAAHNNLGIVARDTGRGGEAIGHFTRAVNIAPDYVDALKHLGTLLIDARRPDEALPLLLRALELAPDSADVYNNLGAIAVNAQQISQARAHFSRALELDPGSYVAASNLGNVLMKLDRLPEARQLFERALAIRPDYSSALNDLGNLVRLLGEFDLALEYARQAVAAAPADAHAHSTLVVAAHYHPNFAPEAIRAELVNWNERHAAPLAPLRRPHANGRDPGRRLKVGYVSSDFRDHSVSFFLVPLLEAHDPAAVETHCYASVPRPDAVTERRRRAAHCWHDALALDDAELAEKVRADGIDILVDLSQHTADNRLLAFARKPAPVQLTWLGFAGSTGVDTIDYRLTDWQMDPPDSDQTGSAEEPLRLPDVWCCYDPLTESPPVSPLPALQNGCVTFGSLNSFVKVNDQALQLWARALGAVSGSRLLLRCPPGESRPRTLETLERFGVEAARVEWVWRESSREGYLRHFHRIDVAVDTLPYNGMTTTCDALHMGVPLLCLPGEMPGSRAGLSLLHAVGLTEWAAADAEDYARKAASLTADLPRLAELRGGLRARMAASPLMDAPRFARHMEAAYRTAWQRWLQQAPA